MKKNYLSYSENFNKIKSHLIEKNLKIKKNSLKKSLSKNKKMIMTK